MLGFIAFEFDGSLYEIPNDVPINDKDLRDSMPVAAFKEFVG